LRPVRTSRDHWYQMFERVDIERIGLVGNAGIGLGRGDIPGARAAGRFCRGTFASFVLTAGCRRISPQREAAPPRQQQAVRALAHGRLDLDSRSRGRALKDSSRATSPGTQTDAPGSAPAGRFRFRRAPRSSTGAAGRAGALRHSRSSEAFHRRHCHASTIVLPTPHQILIMPSGSVSVASSWPQVS